MDINYLREMYTKISPREKDFAPTIRVNDFVTVFTEKVQVKFPKSKKRRVRKKWAKNPCNFEYTRVDKVIRIGNTFYVSKKVYDSLKAKLNKPRFANGGVLYNQNYCAEYVINRPLIEPILIMHSTGGMAGLNINHTVIDNVYPKIISDIGRIPEKFPIVAMTDIG